MAKTQRRGAPVGNPSTSSEEERRSGSSGVDALTSLGNDTVQSMAKEGATGAGSELPFLDQIQSSFGEYDVSGVKAHTDEAAAKGISANAYSLGSDVVFGGSPSLSTAAEEATHSIQQAAARRDQG